MSHVKIRPTHLRRRAVVYLRQSTMKQVHEHRESTQRQYALSQRASELGWPSRAIEIIDEDLGQSGASTQGRSGFKRLAEEISRGRVGVIFSLEVSRLARSSADRLDDRGAATPQCDDRVVRPRVPGLLDRHADQHRERPRIAAFAEEADRVVDVCAVQSSRQRRFDDRESRRDPVFAELVLDLEDPPPQFPREWSLGEVVHPCHRCRDVSRSLLAVVVIGRDRRDRLVLQRLALGAEPSCVVGQVVGRVRLLRWLGGGHDRVADRMDGLVPRHPRANERPELRGRHEVSVSELVFGDQVQPPVHRRPARVVARSPVEPHDRVETVEQVRPRPFVRLG